MITITIKTDNAAFSEDDGEPTGAARQAEIARILRELAEHYENGGVYAGHRLRDVNGNTVGSVEDTD